MTFPSTAVDRRLFTATLVLVVAVFGAYAVLKLVTLPTAGRVLVAAIPLAAFVAFIAVEVRVIRESDELAQRIQLEALAIAYPTGILLVFGLGLLERAGVPVPGFSDLRDVWPLTVLPYFGGLMVARRRYR